MGRPTEVEGQRVETTVPVWLHNMVGSNWGWASGVSFNPFALKSAHFCALSKTA